MKAEDRKQKGEERSVGEDVCGGRQVEQGREDKINCISSYVASINRVCIPKTRKQNNLNCN